MILATENTQEVAQQSTKNGIYKIGSKFEGYVDGQLISAGYNQRSVEIAIEKHLGVYVHGRSKKRAQHTTSVINLSNQERSELVAGVSSNIRELPKFGVNERFDFLGKAIEMVADKVQPSVIITGKGGVGKSYSVRKALLNKNLEDYSGLIGEDISAADDGFVFIKGFSTAKNLYRSLYNNNGSVVVLDDIDSVLKDTNAINILKAVLDSYDQRIVSWGAEMRGDDDLPRSFEFTGSVVIITNLNCSEIEQALLSRSLVIDLQMSPEEIVERMRVIANSPEFLPEYSQQVKQDSIEFIDENKQIAKDLSLRTLVSVSKIRSEFPNDWHNMAKYIMCK